MVGMVCLELHSIEIMVYLKSTSLTKRDICGFSKNCKGFSARDCPYNLRAYILYGECGCSHLTRIPQRKKITIRIMEILEIVQNCIETIDLVCHSQHNHHKDGAAECGEYGNCASRMILAL